MAAEAGAASSVYGGGLGAVKGDRDPETVALEGLVSSRRRERPNWQRHPLFGHLAGGKIEEPCVVKYGTRHVGVLVDDR